MFKLYFKFKPLLVTPEGPSLQKAFPAKSMPSSWGSTLSQLRQAGKASANTGCFRVCEVSAGLDKLTLGRSPITFAMLTQFKNQKVFEAL